MSRRRRNSRRRSPVRRNSPQQSTLVENRVRRNLRRKINLNLYRAGRRIGSYRIIAERLKRLRERSTPVKKRAERKKKAVRSTRSTERLIILERRRNRGKGGPCIEKPDPSGAGKASAELRRKGRQPANQKERNRKFRVWC